MSADFSPQNSPVVESLDALVSWFSEGEKRDSPLRIGTEVEKLTFLKDSLRPLPYTTGIKPLLQALVKHGWEPLPNAEQPTMLKRGSASITLEPGGQIELSGAPLMSLDETAEEVDTFLEHLREELSPLEARISEVALRPDFYPSDVEWMPRARHQIMRDYLSETGRLAHYMMTLTTTIQANLDYISEEDMAQKVRVASRLSPLVTSLFANSPFGPKGLSGYRSHRAAVWFDVDPARCGFPDVYFQEDFGYRSYINWVLDIPMFFVLRNDTYSRVDGLTFRQFLNDGWNSERATIADFELHLSTLFPEVRLKRFIECRSADGGPREMTLALPAFWKGIFYHQASLDAADALTQSWDKSTVVHMQRAAAMDGIKAHGQNWNLRTLAHQVLELSKVGLEALSPNETHYLSPLETIADRGETRADRLIQQYQRAGSTWTAESLECESRALG